MDPGELNRRALVRSWSDIPNIASGIDQKFAAGEQVWVKVEPVHGLAMRAGAATGELPTHLFWLRYSARRRAEDITTSHVFELAGYRYRVLDAINVDDAREFVRVSVKLLGAVT